MKLTIEVDLPVIPKKTELQTAEKLSTGARWALPTVSFSRNQGTVQSLGKSCRLRTSSFSLRKSELYGFCFSCSYLLRCSSTEAKEKLINLLLLRKPEVCLLGKHMYSTNPYVCCWQLNLKLVWNTSVCSKTTYNPENRSFTSAVSQTYADFCL